MIARMVYYMHFYLVFILSVSALTFLYIASLFSDEKIVRITRPSRSRFNDCGDYASVQSHDREERHDYRSARDPAVFFLTDGCGIDKICICSRDSEITQ